MSWLMILGNAGIVSITVTTTSSFITSEGHQLSINAIFRAPDMGTMFLSLYPAFQPISATPNRILNPVPGKQVFV